MKNDALDNVFEAYKDAAIAVIYELKYLFSVGTEVGVRLQTKQKKWSRATVIGHNTHHCGANVRVRLANAREFSRGRVRDVSYNDVMEIL